MMTTDLNENGGKLEYTRAYLELNAKTGASMGAMERVIECFNAKNVGGMTQEKAGRHIGAATNLLCLLAENDIETLVKNWVLDGLE